MTDRQVEFVRYLAKLADPEKGNRAALAALRRGLGKKPGEAAEMYPYVVPFTHGLRGWAEEAYYLIAALFASHPVTWSPEEGRTGYTNMGASLARAAGDQQAGMEDRFVALLNSDRDELPDRLRYAVSLCRANDNTPIDWLTLLSDVQRWNTPVRHAWARAFWKHTEPQADDE